MENYEAASMKELSAKEYNEADNEDLDEQDFLPKGSYGQFIRKAAQGLKIQVNKKVVSINYEGEHVEIKCSDGSTFKCQTLLASIPLGVLKTKKVCFEPPLPHKHQ